MFSTVAELTVDLVVCTTMDVGCCYTYLYIFSIQSKKYLESHYITYL